MAKKYITKENCKEFKHYTFLFTEKKEEIGLFETFKEYLITRRVGKCDFKKCKNACCRFCQAGYVKDYSRGFFDEVDEFGNDIILKKCNNLQKNGTCKLWGKRLTSWDSSKNKGFPIACKGFPHLGDSVYWHVIDLCSFKFEVIYSIKKKKGVSGKYISEMIKNFKEQT